MLTCNFLTWTWFHYCLHTRQPLLILSLRPWARPLLTALSNNNSGSVSSNHRPPSVTPAGKNCLQAKPPWHSQNSEKPLQVVMLLFKDFGIIEVNRWDAKLVPMTVKNNPAQLLFPPATSMTTKPYQPSSPPTMNTVGTDTEVETLSMRMKMQSENDLPRYIYRSGAKATTNWMLFPFSKIQYCNTSLSRNASFLNAQKRHTYQDTYDGHCLLQKNQKQCRGLQLTGKWK